MNMKLSRSVLLSPASMISGGVRALQVGPILLTSLLFCIWPASKAEAIRPRGTTMTGVVLSVDHASRWIVFAQDGGPVRRFVYTEWAKFWHNESEALPAHLKAGMKVQINLRNPLIGPDFVTHIVLLSQQGKTIHPKNGSAASPP